MRILFTTTAGLGHFHPLVPLARAAGEGGHEVAFASPPSLLPIVKASGFQAFPVGPALREGAGDPERSAAMQRVMRLPPGLPANMAMLTDVFIGINSRRVLPDLIAVCRSWSPDLLVREEFEFGAAVAAEHLGLPHAAVQVGYFYNLQSFREEFPMIAGVLDDLRAEWALPADPELAMLYRHLFLSFDPPALIDPSADRPPTMRHLRAEVFDRSSEEEPPDWLNREYVRPLIYATLGSEAAKIPAFFPRVYSTILAGLREVPCTVAMTIGKARNPVELGPQPVNVHLERYVPQSLILPRCDAVITHGGHNTVLAALSFGLPLVIVPFFADQMDNAARCAALETARVIPAPAFSPESVRDAVRQLLAGERYRASASRLREQMETLPGPEAGVRLLETLAAKGRS